MQRIWEGQRVSNTCTMCIAMHMVHCACLKRALKTKFRFWGEFVLTDLTKWYDDLNGILLLHSILRIGHWSGKELKWSYLGQAIWTQAPTCGISASFCGKISERSMVITFLPIDSAFCFMCSRTFGFPCLPRVPRISPQVSACLAVSIAFCLFFCINSWS